VVGPAKGCEVPRWFYVTALLTCGPWTFGGQFSEVPGGIWVSLPGHRETRASNTMSYIIHLEVTREEENAIQELYATKGWIIRAVGEYYVSNVGTNITML
jgi:hypothetical protein